MSNCQYCVPSRGDINIFAKEGGQTLSIQSPRGNSGEESGEVCAEWGLLETAGVMHGEIKARKIVPDFCNVFAKVHYEWQVWVEKGRLKYDACHFLFSIWWGEALSVRKRSQGLRAHFNDKNQEEFRKRVLWEWIYKKESNSSAFSSALHKKTFSVCY